jgi:hypothetical protein
MLEDQTYVTDVGSLPGGLFLSSSPAMFSPGSGGAWVSCNYGGKVVVLEGAGKE